MHSVPKTPISIMIPSIRELHSILFDREACIDFLFQQNILYPAPDCTRCCRKMTRNGDKWRCPRRNKCSGHSKSIFHGTFFANAHIPPNMALLIGYLWLSGCGTAQIQLISGHGKETVTNYLNYFRTLVNDHAIVESEMIGGPGVIVEVDEAKFGKRKYHRGVPSLVAFSWRDP